MSSIYNLPLIYYILQLAFLDLILKHFSGNPVNILGQSSWLFCLKEGKPCYKKLIFLTVFISITESLDYIINNNYPNENVY